MNEPKVVCTPLYGRVEIESWFEWRGNSAIGMGSKKVFDEAGRLVSHEVEPTGVEMHWNERA